MLEKILTDFSNSLIEGFLKLIQFNNLLNLAFFAEEEFSSATGFNFSLVFRFFMDAGICLIGVKFLLKGFNIYILYTEGDADVSPFHLLMRFIKALVMALSFSELYGYLMRQFVQFILAAERQVFGSFLATLPANPIEAITMVSNTLINAVLFIVWIIFAILFWFGFIKRGIEMLILRAGIAWAAAGIINSDDGVWRPYLNKFFQNAITVLVQYLLMIVSLRLIFSQHIFYAVFFLATAVSLPRFLSEFMIAVRGDGGMMSKAYYAGQMVMSSKRAITMLFKR